MTTTIQKDSLLGQLSTLAYKDLSFLNNPANIPAGWSFVSLEVEGPFAAVIFKNAGGQLAIAFRGTNGLNDLSADGTILTGGWNSQFQQGMDLVQRVLKDALLDNKNFNKSQLLVTGHSLGGAIAQIVAHAYGLDGSTIDPGAAKRIVETDGFKAATLAAGLPEGGLGIPSTFTNHLVVNSMVSGGTGDHLGDVSYIPSLNFASGDALKSFLLGLVNPLAGFVYAVGVDQFGNKHSSQQISEALGLLAGLSSDAEGAGRITLSPKFLGWETNSETGEQKARYSQTDFEVKNAAGELQGTVKFSGQGVDRKLEMFDQNGEVQTTVSQSSSGGVVTIKGTGQNIVIKTGVEKVNNDNGTSTIIRRNGNNEVISTTDIQIYDDGTTIEIKTENGQQYVRSTMLKSDDSPEIISTDWKNLTTGHTLTTEQLAQVQTNALYTDMAGFINALRSKDKLNQALYGAKIIIDTQIKDGLPPSLLGMQTAIGGLSATVGVVAGLHALQSDDTRTQISGTVGLLSSANQLAAYHNVGDATQVSEGILSNGQLGMLNTMGALISIANLRNLDTMIENGQVGSAAATVYTSWQAGSALATAAAAEGSFSASMSAAASFNPAVALAMVVGAYVLDDFFSDDAPPPPPPFGKAHFVRALGGGLTITYTDTNDLGQSILQTKMTEILTALNQDLAAANQGNTDPERALVLIASRIPKVYIQSWPSYSGNGETNYYYVLEQTHPQNGQKVYSGVARQDIAKFFSGSLVLPEAIAQQWQVNHMTAKFGTDEANWQTEGQWATAHSAIEQTRGQLGDALTAAKQTLTTAKERTLHFFGDTLQVDAAQQTTQQEAITAAQLQVDAAQKAYDLYNAQHPLSPQEAALIMDGTHSDVLADPEAYASARQAATQQWLKVITLDWNGDGVISKTMPTLNAQGQRNTDPRGMAADGNARFDADGDGYREVTEWVGNTEFMLGIDRDGNGLIDTASELFNAGNTPFDMQGLQSLKYYDSNNDNKITTADNVWKLLRLWNDLNGDGSAGSLETYTMEMAYAGVDMAQLKQGLDAASKAAVEALQQLAVQEIDLATGKVTLANGQKVQASEQALKADVLGVRVVEDADTHNVSVLKEQANGSDPREMSADGYTRLDSSNDKNFRQAA